MLSLEEAIQHCEEVADVCEDSASKYDLTDAYESYMAGRDGECASNYRQLAEWLKRLKRIEDYIADGKDDIECTYSLCFYEIEAVMNGEI